MKTKNTGKSRIRRYARGVLAAALAAAGTAAGAVAFGILDYLYEPEFFRPGKKPRPSREIAPGEAEVYPSLLRAGGGTQSVNLRFRCGPGGISEDGGIKINFCRLVDFGPEGRRQNYLYADGWGPRQNLHPRFANYYNCELKSAGGARLEVVSQGFFPLRAVFRLLGREFLRWRGVKLEPLDVFYLYMELRKIRIRVRDDRLQEGDEIIVHLGDTRYGSRGWSSPAHPSRVDIAIEVDERSTGLYRLIADNPVLEAVGGEAAALDLVLSSFSPQGEGRLVIRAVDKRGDVDPTYTGGVELVPAPGLESPYSVEFRPRDGGVVQVTCRVSDPGVYRVGATGKGIAGESNPVTYGGDARLFWGDIHVHTALCDGCLDPNRFYPEARDTLGLDFAAITTHDTMDKIEPSGREDEWTLIRNLQESYNEPGRFVTLLAYEIAEDDGDYNIYYRTDEAPWYIPATHAWELFRWLRVNRFDAVVVPHMTSYPVATRGFDFNYYDPELMRLAEIASTHGNGDVFGDPRPLVTTEPGGFISEALARGYRLGLIGSGDGHQSRPGNTRDRYDNGLVAVYAETLTREAIFDALKQRACYAATNARILVEFSINGVGMGQELTLWEAERFKHIKGVRQDSCHAGRG